MSNDADALVFTFNFDDDGLESLDNVHVRLPSWIPKVQLVSFSGCIRLRPLLPDLLIAVRITYSCIELTL
jgi:hypothetical protein